MIGWGFLSLADHAAIWKQKAARCRAAGDEEGARIAEETARRFRGKLRLSPAGEFHRAAHWMWVGRTIKAAEENADEYR